MIRGLKKLILAYKRSEVDVHYYVHVYGIPNLKYDTIHKKEKKRFWIDSIICIIYLLLLQNLFYNIPTECVQNILIILFFILLFKHISK